MKPLSKFHARLIAENPAFAAAHEARILAHQERVQAEEQRRGIKKGTTGPGDPQNRRPCVACGRFFQEGNRARTCRRCLRRRKEATA